MKLVTSKTFYREHLPPDLPIFYRPFFLDVVTGGNWEVCCVCHHDRIVAIMPYPIDQGRYSLVRQPAFTIYLGPLVLENERVNISVGLEMEILELFADSIKEVDYYNQNWYPSSRNWLPFYWKGYIQSSRYSYIIPVSLTIGDIRARYNKNVRRNLKRGAPSVKIEEPRDPKEFFQLLGKTFERKGMDQPYDLKLFNKLVEECFSKKCCSILLARDSSGNVHAGMFLVWDDQCVYYMAGGVDDKFKKSGAMTLLFDRAIEFAAGSGKSFDFEGSMIQSVEKYFRSFGAVQQEYFVVTRVNSPFLRLCFALGKIHSIFDPF